jgi:ADP-ribose pyrophosphatase YjhB (NUDIX family)
VDKKWYSWAQTIQSIAQAGLEYSRDPYDRERFRQLRRLSVEIVSEYTELTTQKVTELFANETGYQTPKVDVRAVVQHGGKLLLVQENDEKWSLPGGWAEPNLSVRQNAEREVLEESGFKVEASRLVAVLDRNRHVDDEFPYSVYKIFVECTYLEGEFSSNIETSDARFFSREEIPELSTTRTTMAQVQMCFDHLAGKHPGVLFD